MSNLSTIEKHKLEKFFNMADGYVLDFSKDNSFKEFVLENTGIDIYETKYSTYGTSKAKRLRAFWKEEPNNTVGKLTLALLTHKIKRVLNPAEQALFDECVQIFQRLIQGGQNNQDGIAVKAHFDDIRKNIIAQLELAKFTIWLAVAWFTDKVLFDCLVAKKNQGVNVQLIIVDDETNRNSRLEYEKEFETYRVRKVGEYGNIMHDKFCIIDLKTVIHGSYNWTQKAQFNRETIAIVNNRELAEQFAEEFIKLK